MWLHICFVSKIKMEKNRKENFSINYILDSEMQKDLTTMLKRDNGSGDESWDVNSNCFTIYIIYHGPIMCDVNYKNIRKNR